MGLSAGEGVVVASVRNDGPAAQAGVEPGDVIPGGELAQDSTPSASTSRPSARFGPARWRSCRLQRQQSSIYVAVRISTTPVNGGRNLDFDVRDDGLDVRSSVFEVRVDGFERRDAGF